MNDLEQFVLSHTGAPYDPQKARDYYLRNRVLKGRRPGAVKESGIGESSSQPPAKTKKPTTRTPAQRRAQRKAKVEALQARLDRLNTLLTELVKQAKARSGVETKESPSKSSTKTASKKTSDLTAKQKNAAAKASEKYREENKETLAKQAEKLQGDIKEVRAKIKEVRDELKASINRSRSKSKT